MINNIKCYTNILYFVIDINILSIYDLFKVNIKFVVYIYLVLKKYHWKL